LWEQPWVALSVAWKEFLGSMVTTIMWNIRASEATGPIAVIIGMPGTGVSR
jgi:hypothetical protein